MSLSLRVLRSGLLLGLFLGASDAAAQYPQQPQPYPQQPQPYPQQPYPQQPQQYPPPQQQYPAQPYPQQPYPQQPQQYPPPQQQYPQQPYPPPQQQYPQQPYPQQPVQPVAPPVQTTRGTGEMTALYITSALWGIGSGIWIDALAGIDEPGPAIVLPIVLGVGAPIGVYFWDNQAGPLHRGVPAATSAGLVLGAVEGIAIDGTQWQYTREKNHDWNFATQTTVAWIFATGGGIGGWAFGEWIRPDPRSMTFTASGAAWGALSGSMFGIAVQGRHDDWKDGSSIAGLIGYNVGMVGGAAISILHTPTYNSQKYMWLGYVLGAVAGSLVFPFYLFAKDPNVKTGLIGPALGGLAGTTLAGVLTWNLADDDGSHAGQNFKAPLDVAMAPVPSLVSASDTSLSAQSVRRMAGSSPQLTMPGSGMMLTLGSSF